MSYANQRAFELECERQVEEFVREYNRTEGDYVPLPLLHAFISEHVLLNIPKGSFHPSLSPEECQRGLIARLWHSSMSKVHPELLDDIFHTSAIPEQFYHQALRQHTSIDEVDFTFMEKSQRKGLLLEAEESEENMQEERDLELDAIESNLKPSATQLRYNVREPPDLPPFLPRGNTLQSFFLVGISFVK